MDRADPIMADRFTLPFDARDLIDAASGDVEIRERLGLGDE
jgi:hypothetical protein